MKAGTLQVSTPSNVEIELTRYFDASPELLFEAHTDPTLVRRWMTGPDGWHFVTCEIDLRVGGAYRFVWAKQGQPQMGASGLYREIDRPERIVFSERFDESWYPGEALVTITFGEQGGGTLLRELIRYESREARDTALRSGMEGGVAAGYDRLEQYLGQEVQ